MMNAVECSLWSVVYLVTGDSCEAFELCVGHQMVW